jgi:hypothetical protein
MWNGTPQSRFILPQTGFGGSSFANDIEVDEVGHKRIVGGTWPLARAVMWNHAVPEPTTLAGVSGLLTMCLLRRIRRKNG